MAFAMSSTVSGVGGIRAQFRAPSPGQARGAARLAPLSHRRSFAVVTPTSWKGNRQSIAVRAEETPSKQVVPETPSAPGTPPSKGGAGEEEAAAKEEVATEDMTPDEFGAKLRELKNAQAEAAVKPGIVQGVLEEIKEIEWPGAATVASTTVVVCTAIVGSSLLLLTINSTFNELSKAVF